MATPIMQGTPMAGGLPPGMAPPGMGQPPPPSTGVPVNSPQIKVGWFREGTLFIQDIGVTFEKITKPGHLLNVQVGQFDALLTVKDMDDIERIKNALATGPGINIKDQFLKEFMLVRDDKQQGPPGGLNGVPAGPQDGLPVGPPGGPQNALPGRIVTGLSGEPHGLGPPASLLNFSDVRSKTPPPVSTKFSSFNEFDDTNPAHPPPAKRRSRDRSPDRRRRSRSRDRDSKSREKSRRRSKSRERSTKHRSQNNSTSHDMPEPLAPPPKLTATILRKEIETRKKALEEIRNSCDPLVAKLDRLFPMRAEQIQLIKRRDALARKKECIVMATDKEAEPYMMWLVQELKKKSTKDVEFRAEGVKCFESGLSNEEAFASKGFEEGVLLVMSVNKVNEQKRSVTVHLCMNGLNQIHKNMGVRDALQMIQDQWDAYLRNLEEITGVGKQPGVVVPPPTDLQHLLTWASEGKDLQTEQYDMLISFLTEKRNINLKNAGTDPESHKPDARAMHEGKDAAQTEKTKNTSVESVDKNPVFKNPMFNQNSILNQIIPKTSVPKTSNDISIIEPSGDTPRFEPSFIPSFDPKNSAAKVDQNLLERVAGLVGGNFGSLLNESSKQPENMNNFSDIQPPNVPPPNSFNKFM
jgi:hypothetical protein